jgi:hypothetical protein
MLLFGAAKSIIIRCTERSLNRPLEEVNKWSIPSRFEGFYRRLFYKQKKYLDKKMEFDLLASMSKIRP